MFRRDRESKGLKKEAVLSIGGGEEKKTGTHREWMQTP